MKYFVFAALVFVNTTVIPMEHNQEVPAESVAAAARALHEQHAQGFGERILEKCTENVISGIITGVVVFVLVDMYKGSKGQAYKLIWGQSEKEKHEALMFAKQAHDLETEKVALIEGRIQLQKEQLKDYVLFMKERIQEAKDEKEKNELQSSLKNTLDQYRIKQEHRLLSSSIAVPA